MPLVFCLPISANGPGSAFVSPEGAVFPLFLARIWFPDLCRYSAFSKNERHWIGNLPPLTCKGGNVIVRATVAKPASPAAFSDKPADPPDRHPPPSRFCRAPWLRSRVCHPIPASAWRKQFQSRPDFPLHTCGVMLSASRTLCERRQCDERHTPNESIHERFLRNVIFSARQSNRRFPRNLFRFCAIND